MSTRDPDDEEGDRTTANIVLLVGFACEFPRGYDPVKAGRWWWSP